MDGQSSALEDPFSDFSLLSLFPRTFNQHGLDPDTGPVALYKDTPEDVRSLFDSMALKNPNRLTEQAKSALESVKVQCLEITRSDDGVSDLQGVVHGNLQVEVESMEIARDENTVSDLPKANHENLRRQRPGLVGRKKASFSFKPNSSQSLESLLPELDIAKLRDPEEFFLAFERHENAKNELRRLSGKPLADLDQNVHHRAERRRRPGLSRKPAVYKHRYPVAQSGDDNNFLSSQETLSQDLFSPTPSNQLQTEYTDKIPVLSTRELSGPMVAGRDKPADISEELETGQDNDDESDDIIGMLKERFKPIEINKSCLPDLTSVLQSEFKTLGESLHDSQDKMSDLHGIVSAIGKETTLGCNKERSSGRPSTSVTPPKSPYSSMSLLKARLNRSRQGIDRFSALDIDLSPPEKAASYEDTNDLAARDNENSVKDSKKRPKISTANTMHIGSGHATGGDDTMETNENESETHVASKDTQDLAAAKFTSSEKSISNDKVMPAVLSDSIEHMELDHDTVEPGERDINPKSPLHENESVTTHTMETDLDHGIGRDQSSIPAAHDKESSVLHRKDIHVELDHDFTVNDRRGSVMEENPSEAFDDVVIAADQHIEPDGWVAEENVQGRNMEKLSHNKEQSTASAVEDLDMDRRSGDHDKLPTDFPASGHDEDLEGATGDLVHDRPASSQAQPLEGTPKASSKTSKGKRRKVREPSHEHPPAKRRIAKAASKHAREFKENSRRKSLAACGTRWEKGIRQSTRIRTRPLEFWKGERLLYGRIHENLITVVGAKYFSPMKEGGPATLKVKSYVSDEYMDIVEQAALH